MRFSCDSCQARYTIADEKVRGKILRVRCKRCGSSILLREQEGGDDEEVTTGGLDDDATRVVRTDEVQRAMDRMAHAAAQPPPPAAAAASKFVSRSHLPPVKAAAPAPSRQPSTILEPAPAAVLQAAAAARAAAAAPPAPAPRVAAKPAEKKIWYVLLQGKETGPLAIADFKARADSGEVTPRTYAWRDGMGQWQRVRDIPELAPHVPAAPSAPAPARPPPAPVDDSARRAEDDRRAAALKAAEAARLAAAEEARLVAEESAAAAAREAEEEEKALEAAIAADEQRLAAEADEARQAEELKAEEARQAEHAAAEERKAEAARKAAETLAAIRAEAAAAEKAEEEKQARAAEAAKKAEDDKKAGDAKADDARQSDAKKAELEKKAADDRKAEEDKKAAAKKAEDDKKAAAKKAEEDKKAAAKKADDKPPDSKKADDDKKPAEKKADDKKADKSDDKKTDDDKKAADKKADDDKKAADKKASANLLDLASVLEAELDAKPDDKPPAPLSGDLLSEPSGPLVGGAAAKKDDPFASVPDAPSFKAPEHGETTNAIIRASGAKKKSWPKVLATFAAMIAVLTVAGYYGLKNAGVISIPEPQKREERGGTTVNWDGVQALDEGAASEINGEAKRKREEAVRAEAARKAEEERKAAEAAARPATAPKDDDLALLTGALIPKDTDTTGAIKTAAKDDGPGVEATPEMLAQLAMLRTDRKPGSAAPTLVHDTTFDLKTAQSAESGGPDMQVVAKKVGEIQPAIGNCVGQALMRNKDQRLGKIVVTATVGPSGIVPKAVFSGDKYGIANSDLGECVRRTIKSMVFPAFEGEAVDIEIPLVLGAG